MQEKGLRREGENYVNSEEVVDQLKASRGKEEGEEVIEAAMAGGHTGTSRTKMDSIFISAVNPPHPSLCSASLSSYALSLSLHLLSQRNRSIFSQ